MSGKSGVLAGSYRGAIITPVSSGIATDINLATTPVTNALIAQEEQQIKSLLTQIDNTIDRAITKELLPDPLNASQNSALGRLRYLKEHRLPIDLHQFHQSTLRALERKGYILIESSDAPTTKNRVILNVVMEGSPITTKREFKQQQQQVLNQLNDLHFEAMYLSAQHQAKANFLKERERELKRDAFFQARETKQHAHGPTAQQLLNDYHASILHMSPAEKQAFRHDWKDSLLGNRLGPNAFKTARNNPDFYRELKRIMDDAAFTRTPYHKH